MEYGMSKIMHFYWFSLKNNKTIQNRKVYIIAQTDSSEIEQSNGGLSDIWKEWNFDENKKLSHQVERKVDEYKENEIRNLSKLTNSTIFWNKIMFRIQQRKTGKMSW